MQSRPTRREFLGAVAGATAAATLTSGATGQSNHGDWPMGGYDAANTAANLDADGPQDDIGTAWQFEADGQFGTPPTVADGTIYAGGLNGDLSAVDAASGDEEWSLNLGAEIRSPPTVVGGLVIVGAYDGTVYAFDSSDGDQVWTFDTLGPVEGGPAVRYDDQGDPDLLIVGSWDSNVYGIDVETGDEEWVYDGFDNGIEDGVAIAHDIDGMDLAVVASDEGQEIQGIDAATGEPRWGNRGAVSTAPVVADRTVYVGSRDQTMIAYDVESGDLESQFATDGEIVASPAVAVGHVYLPSRDEHLYALDAEGQEWTYDAGLRIIQSPAVGAGSVYVASVGELVALDRATGESRWAIDLGRPSAPTVVDGRIYVTTGTTLLALEEGGDEIVIDDDPARQTGGDGLIEDDDGILTQLRFLLWPASVVALLGTFFGILYAAKRVGMLDRIEESADSLSPDAGEVDIGPSDSDDDEPPTSLGPGTPSPVWELVQEDVINRADETTKTATNDLVVTKYVDRATLESPLVAYEIESVRDEPATVTIREPLAIEDPPGEKRPIGDTWQVVDEHVSFEATIEPGQTMRTVVGRRDVEDDDDDALLERPDITVKDS